MTISPARRQPRTTLVHSPYAWGQRLHLLLRCACTACARHRRQLVWWTRVSGSRRWRLTYHATRPTRVRPRTLF